MDDEIKTVLAQALLRRKAPTTCIGPYVAPDGKYLVSRDRERTQSENVRITAMHGDVKIGHSVQAPAPNFIGVSWLGTIGSVAGGIEWTLEKECTNSDPPDGALPSNDHVRLVYWRPDPDSPAGTAYTVRSASPGSSGSEIIIADSQSEEGNPPVAHSYVVDINEEVQSSTYATWQAVDGGTEAGFIQSHFGARNIGEGEAIQDSSTPIQQGWISPERLRGRLGIGEGAMAQDDGQNILRWYGDEESEYGKMVEEDEPPEVPPQSSDSTTAQASASTAPMPQPSSQPSPEGTPEPEEPAKPKEVPKPPQPIMSRRQLKTVLRGLQEVVAEDRFLQAVALQATLDDISHLWHLPQVSTRADLRERLRQHAEEGPPGLVLLTQKEVSKETLLELQCIGDLEQFTAILITPKDQPQLEHHIELRGDLQISGIGPEIASG